MNKAKCPQCGQMIKLAADGSLCLHYKSKHDKRFACSFHGKPESTPASQSTIAALLSQDIPLTPDNVAKARHELSKLQAVADDAIVANNALAAVLEDSKPCRDAMPGVNWHYADNAAASLRMSLLLLSIRN